MKHVRKSIVTLLLAALLVGAGATTATAAVQDDVVAAVNQQRNAVGVGALKRDTALDAAAQEWAQTMRNTGSLTHSSNAWRSARIPIGWNSHAENIAYGYGSTAAVTNGWMNSPVHKANILRSSYTRMGVGYVASGNYWVQIFAGYATDVKVAGPPLISPSPVGRAGGSAKVGSPLTVIPGTWAAGTKLTYQWYLNGQVVPGATEVKFTPRPDAAGQRASAAVSGTLSGFARTTRMSALSGIIQALPEISPAPVGRPGGSAKVGSAMTILPGTWAPGASLSFQWNVNGVPVAGATQLKFTPRTGDIGKRATVTVTGKLAGFAPTTRVTTSSGIVQPQFAEVSPSPVGRAGGSARAGLPLTAVTGQWAAGAVLTYQWYVNGVVVPGATAAKFVPGPVHVGGRASAAVTGKLAGFAPTTRVTTSSGIIQPQ